MRFFLFDSDYINFFCFIGCLFICVMLFDLLRGLAVFSIIIAGYLYCYEG